MNAHAARFDHLPVCLARLMDQPRWVGWRWVERKGKRTKPPFQASGEMAHNDNPETWATAAAVMEAAPRHGFEGLGLQLLNLRGFAALDLDNVRDPDTGALLPWAEEAVGCGSYAEVTPSGTGLRILGRVDPDAPRRHRKFRHPDGGEVEFYVATPTGRYITVTGDRLDAAPDALNPIGPLVDRLWSEVAPREEPGGFDFDPGSRGRSQDFDALPEWIRTYIAHGGTGDRSGDFQAAVNGLHGRVDFDTALRFFREHPSGPASKYRDRLERELRRSWEKAAASSRRRPTEGADRQGDAPSWLDACILDGRNKKPIPNLANVMVALRSDPALLDAVAFDQMANLPMLTRAMPRGMRPGDPCTPRPVTDQDAGALQEHLQQVGLERLSRETVFQAIEMRAHERAVHLVREYLSSLAWDGTRRLDRWLSTYLGAEPTTYVGGVGRMFLIAMVARVFRPGCKADHLLVLEGPQGARKSTACAILGGAWFSDALPEIGQGKEAAAHLAGKWLIEVGEMHALGKAEATLLKAFITRTTERYRPAYGRMEVVQPRQCVFVATTNESTYLRDATGGRRFWPVKVGAINTDALAADRDQLLAEAVVAFNAGNAWWPAAGFEREHIAPQQESRFEADPWEQAVAEFFAERPQATVSEIARGALGFETARISTSDQRRIVAVLESMGMVRRPKDWRGNRYWARP